MRAYVIHLARSVARRPNVDTLLQTLPDAEVVDAVDGRDPARIAAAVVRCGDQYKPRYPFPLSAAEIGLFLSHRACWERIANSKSTGALIAEDDLQLDPETWPRVLNLVDRNLTSDCVIRLPAKLRERPISAIDEEDGISLFRPRTIGLQTVGTFVGRNAARRLLCASQVLDRPVDTFLQMHWVTGQPVDTVWPSGIREASGVGGSTIQKKSRASGKLTREFQRAVYRARVALRPQRAR